MSKSKTPKQNDDTIPVRIDKNTIVYVRKGADIEKIKQKFANRKGRGDYAYLFNYGEHNSNGRIKPL